MPSAATTSSLNVTFAVKAAEDRATTQSAMAFSFG